MSRNANLDRAAQIRKASAFPVGSPERKAILAGLRKASADIKSGALGFAGNNTLILQVGTKMIRIALSREELAQVAAGNGIFDVKVDLGINDDVPAYVQIQLRETQAKLASALSQLSNITKKF